MIFGITEHECGLQYGKMSVLLAIRISSNGIRICMPAFEFFYYENINYTEKNE